MAKDVDATLEYLANTTFETLRDVCTVQSEIEAVQTGQVTCLEDTTQIGIDALAAAGGGGGSQDEFYVANCNHWSVTNGGKCCDWTVPEGTQSIKFTIVSGGGPGGGTSDNDWGNGGAGGNTAIKTIQESAGDFSSTAGSLSSFTLCAAGTSQCGCCQCCEACACRPGCTSYVSGPGLSNFCAIGAKGGDHFCDVQCSCYNCFRIMQCNMGRYNAGWKTHMCSPGWCGADYGFTGTSGGVYKGYSCNSYQTSSPGTPTGPFSAASPATGLSLCSDASGCYSGTAMFPGGGGYAGVSDNGCCWGNWGAAGLVHVQYTF